MGRRSMDELLTAFDPLHSASSSSSAQHPQTSSEARTASSSNSHAGTSGHAPVPLSQAPLDLLSLDDDANAHAGLPPNSSLGSGTAAISRQPVHSFQQSNTTQPNTLRRQDDLLSELQNADQGFGMPALQGSNPASNGHIQTGTSPPSTERPGARYRRQSSGFSPPRRMSRSGLMHDENAILEQAIRAQQKSPTSPHSPIDIAGPTLPRTFISEEPAVFHPSSPPAGTTIENLRSSSYFPSATQRGTTIPPPPGHHTFFDRPVASQDRQRRTSSSDRQAFQAFRDGSRQVTSPQSSNGNGQADAAIKKQPSSRTAFIHNALRSPLPPFASPSLRQSTSGHPQQPIPGPPSNQNFTTSTPAHASINAPPSPIAKNKPTRKSTFEFPTFSSLGSPSTSASGSRNSPIPPPQVLQANSGSNTPSPASSLIIDSDPLPSLVLKVTGVASESRRVLTEDIADGIRMALPPRIKLCKTWTLLYSLDAHGTSLTTLYTRVQAGLKKSAGGCVLVVKDMEGGIFGAYVNEAFKKSESYYGNGECFLWKVESFPPGDNFRVGPIVRPYRWTARNDYIILSDSNFLSVGGGDGKFGLWLDSSFDKGFTTSCPAFGNDPLCADSLIRPGVDGNPEGKFEIMAVECWAVG